MNDSALHVDVLGPLRARVGAQEVDLGPARQRAVFAVLAMRATKRPISLAELIDAVWGSAAPAGAVGAVHTYISGLRGRLEPGRARRATGGPLVSCEGGYRLSLADNGLDADTFERQCRDAHALGQARDAAGAVTVLDAALALWRGETLSGIGGPFAEEQRARLGESRLAALEQRAVQQLELGAQADLIPELTMLVRLHPLRESLWRTLMIALHRGDRSGEALDAFERVRTILRVELGATPGRQLGQVHQQILAGAPAVGGCAEALLSVRPNSVVAPGAAAPALFGRTAEQARLRELISELRRGSGEVIWFEGEDGIGKSALLANVLGGLTDCHLAWGVPDEQSRSAPFRTLLDCLGLPAPGIGSDTDSVSSTAERLYGRVETLCSGRPLVLVIDDLQLADEASLTLWHRLVVATRRLALLLVCTTRPAAGRDDLARLRRSVQARGHEVRTLARLGPDAARSLARELVGARLGPELDRLVTSQPANPRRLRTRVSALTGTGAIDISGDLAELRLDRAHHVESALPCAEENSLPALSEDTRKVLAHAAMLGTDFDIAELAAAMRGDLTQLLGPLEEALDAAIIVEAGNRLAFRHPRLRWTPWQGLNDLPSAG